MALKLCMTEGFSQSLTMTRRETNFQAKPFTESDSLIFPDIHSRTLKRIVLHNELCKHGLSLPTLLCRAGISTRTKLMP